MTINAFKLVRLSCEAAGWVGLMLVVSLLIYMLYEFVVENARQNAEKLDAENSFVKHCGIEES